MDKKDKSKSFTSAMDDLKGLLDKEGIDINTQKEDAIEASEIPTLSPDNIDTNDITEAINNDLINDFEQSLKQKPADISKPDDDAEAIDLPVLDGTITVIDEQPQKSTDLDDYIADMDDDEFDVMDFASSVEELGEKVEAIKEPEHLQEFMETQSENVTLQQIKTKLQKSLALEIDQAIEELKNKLLDSLNREIDQIFKK